MKTTTTSSVSRFTKFARVCLAACVSLVTLSAAPRSMAAAPNGAYEIIGGSGSLSSSGQTITIPKQFFKELAKQGGDIVVKNNKLQINRYTTADVFEVILPGAGSIIEEVKVTGPSSITLTPTGESFAGKTTQPILTTLIGVDNDDEDFTVKLTTNVSATVTGNRITVTLRFSGGDKNAQVSGKITLRGKL